jgi:hypothetical protein
MRPADGSRAQWDQQQRERHTNNPAAAPAKPDQAAKPAESAADKTLKVGNTTLTESEVQEFLARKAGRESGKLQAPESPDGYKIELPKDFTPPVGVEVAFNEADPAFAELRAWAHAHQIPQSAFSDLLAVYGGKVAGDLAAGKAAHGYQVGLLGRTGPGRVDALATWMKGMLGDQGAVLTGTRGPDGNVRNGVLWTAAVISAFEALQRRFVSQGASGYTGNGRDMGNPDPGKIPNYAGMTFEQRRHAQDQRRER